MRIFTKTLCLVAALLLGGMNAWAEDEYTTLYERASVSDWVDTDKTDWNASSAVGIDATYGIGANANTTATYLSKTFSTTDKYKVKYVVDWTFACATGRTGNWNWIQFGDFLRIAINSTYNMQVSTDAGATWNATPLAKYSNATFTKRIEIIFDTQLKTIESFKWDGSDKTSLVSNTFSDASFNTVSTGFVRGGSVGWNLINYITTISVSQAKQAEAEEASYTINYKLGDEIVKTVASTSVAGAEITAETAIDGEGTYEGNHYLITADEAPSMTLVAGDNVLNVPVRAPYTATLSVTYQIAGVAQDPVVTNLTETDDKVCAWTYAYPLYVKSGDIYYVADATETFGEGGTFTDGQEIAKTVTYTNADEDVVFFQEAEAAAGTSYTYSNGADGYVAAQNKRDRGISVGTLPAGKYQFIANLTAANKRSLVIRQSTNDPLASVGTSKEDLTIGIKTADFKLEEETENLFINGANSGTEKSNQSENFDYVIIKNLGSTVDYTINYICDEVTINTVNGSDKEGTTINAETELTIDNQKYFAADGATTSITLAEGENILNVEMRKAYEYSVKVNLAYGDAVSTLVDSTVVEEESMTYYFPAHVKDGEILYQFESNNDPNYSSYFSSTISNVTKDITYTISYELVEGKCVFYAEGEDIEGAVKYATSTFAPRSSAGATGVLAAATITTLPKGVYNITARAIGKANNDMNIYTGSTEGTNILSFKTNTTGTVATSENFTLTEETAIVANGGYYTTSDNGYGFDYFYIMFDEVATAIQNVASQQTEKVIYNLQGQRIMKAQKGLNIINGKKVIVK